jgi:hypothetical protein
MLRVKNHRRPLLLAGLTLTIALSGCGAAATPGGATASPSASAAAETAVAEQPTSAPPTTVPPTIVPTSAPAPSDAPTTQPTSAPQPSDDQATAPVQTLLDYYRAINQKQYEQAYGSWLNDGAASNQTLDQFKEGFADTVEINVLLNSPKVEGASAGSVTIPTTVFSVIDDPSSATSGQAVRGFGGTYTLVRAADGSGWRIASADMRALPSGAGLGQDYDDPSRLLAAYYEAINNRDFALAYSDWRDPAGDTQQSYAQFYQGFADTRQVEVELGASQSGVGAGNLYATIPIVINATQSDGSQQTFCGNYQLHRANIEPWNQLGWRLERAEIAPHAAVALGTDQSRQLLTNGCQ